jgi:two-component system chemotaxis response regulator CheB
MPGEFTGAFAKRLNIESRLFVKEAEDGDIIKKGCVYIANGYNHLILGKDKNDFVCRLENGALVNRHRPSVDVLFNSATKFDGKNIVAALLTGMGADGANGLLALRNTGARTFAQDEKSCVVFGMPKEAIKLNAAQKTGSPDDLANWLNTIY